MADDTIARRKFLLGAGVAGTAAAFSSTTPAEAQAQASVRGGAPIDRRFFVRYWQ